MTLRDTLAGRPELHARYRVAVDAAHAAGELIAAAFGSRNGVVHKSAVDLVTATDRAAELLIVSQIAATFPDDRVVAEEGTDRAGAAASPWRWLVDPLDGTTNFVHGLLHVAVSIGVHHDGVGVIGVIHAPLLGRRGRTWRAASGQGAYRDDVAIRVADTANLSDAMVGTGFPYDRRESARELADGVARALVRCRALRRRGAAALDLASVADGTFEGFWEARLKPWDIAAGEVLVREAGGRVTDFLGGSDHLATGCVVATNGHIHEALRTGVAAPADRHAP